jgi:hypothetical protein
MGELLLGEGIQLVSSTYLSRKSFSSLTNYSALSWTQILVVDQSCASKTITESSSEIITIVDSILSSRTSARRQFWSWGMSGRRREVGTGALMHHESYLLAYSFGIIVRIAMYQTPAK